MKHLRHAVYWVAVGAGIIPILYAISGAWLNEHLEPLYGQLRTWAWQERYVRPPGWDGPPRKVRK